MRFVILCLGVESIENWHCPKPSIAWDFVKTIGVGRSDSAKDLCSSDLATMTYAWHLLHKIIGLSDPLKLESDAGSAYTGFEKLCGLFWDEKSIFKLS
ncbi:hypothetical protein ACFX16_000451 [Malus domestica]